MIRRPLSASRTDSLCPYTALCRSGAGANGAGVDGIVLPKDEHPDQRRAVRAALPGGARVVVGLESVRGVADSRTLLAEGPDAAYFGAEDRKSTRLNSSH